MGAHPGNWVGGGEGSSKAPSHPIPARAAKHRGVPSRNNTPVMKYDNTQPIPESYLHETLYQ